MAATDVEAVDFEPEEDDLMDEDGMAVDADGGSSPRSTHPRIKSAITGVGGGGGSSAANAAASAAEKRTKGRGFRQEADNDRNSRLTSRDFDSLDSDGGPGPARCCGTKINLGVFVNSQQIWGIIFLVFGLASFGAFFYAAVISKLMSPLDNPLISAIQKDRYYCFLVPLSLPILVIAVYFHWLNMKLFKHA